MSQVGETALARALRPECSWHVEDPQEDFSDPRLHRQIPGPPDPLPLSL